MDVFRPELQAFPLRAILDEAQDTLGVVGVEAVLQRYGVSSEDLTDKTAWVSLDFVESLMEDVEREVDDAHFLDRAMSRAITPKYIGPLYPLFVAFGSPLFTYRQLPAMSGRVDKIGSWVCEGSSRGAVRMVRRAIPGASQETRTAMCRMRVAQFRRIPTLFNCPPAEVRHPHCALEGAEACVYEVKWDEPQPSRHGLAGLLAGTSLACLSTLALELPAWATFGLIGSLGLGGWALGRIWVLRRELRGRVQEIGEHSAALDRVTQANERRFEELLEAKREVDQKVELRTRELGETADRLAVTLAEVQALDRAKTDFFNNVSHELRSPLTMILAPLEDLVAGRPPPGGREAAMEAMRRNASRLLQLINQLLDLAKIDAGKAQIALAPTDISALVGRTTDGFAAAAQAKGVELVVENAPSIPDTLVDAAWIESALGNLVANALRFTDEGGRVAVSVHDRGADIRLVVSDDGPGIAQIDQANIFERFGQADRTGPMVGGTGIGLALVREAARLHDGDASVDSTPGKGSRFTLILPRRTEVPRSAASAGTQPGFKPTADMVNSPQPTRGDEREGPSPRAPIAVVVEDNNDLRALMMDVLAAEYRVHAAADGERGIELARTVNPDVIVSDVAMPKVDGYDLCRALRGDDRTRGIPILLVTARTDVARVLEGFEAGADDYINKPFHGRELLARVSVHVRLRRVLREATQRERHAMLGEVAASVAHQVRNPLTTLVSGLPAMRKKLADQLDPSSTEMIDVMIHCSERIERMTTDLMDLSRIDRAEDDAFRLSDGLRSALRLARARAPDGVVIEESIDDPEPIMGRAGDVNHVYLNLLDNALRAVGEQGQVRVEGRIEDLHYVVQVHDSGLGVSEEVALRMFQPFYTTRPAGQGTGLGLAIADQVASHHGGDIGVSRSRLGGALLTLRIPLRCTTTPEDSASQAAKLTG